MKNHNIRNILIMGLGILLSLACFLFVTPILILFLIGKLVTNYWHRKHKNTSTNKTKDQTVLEGELIV